MAGLGTLAIILIEALGNMELWIENSCGDLINFGGIYNVQQSKSISRKIFKNFGNTIQLN